MEMDSVIWFTFDYVYSFIFEAGAEVVECLVEQPGKQK
jgi:hypothetical protein